MGVSTTAEIQCTFRVCKTIRFEAAHQLERAYSKACVESIHGHSYRVDVVLASRCLNPDLMVLDFGLISKALAQVVEEWDHALILPTSLLHNSELPDCHKVVEFPCNPTAEVMAAFIFGHVQKALAVEVEHGVMSKDNGVRVERVRVHETETSWAEATAPPRAHRRDTDDRGDPGTTTP